ncbi:unnamed protein product [Candidula unifasciata]|uniref:Armadillo repeat-containing domain-containing protein n=1 Tax=Candidula unifasciata TaxID=100452 RepID=A0A8S3YNJ9_9EUPU|nr:unnamed protein product [Candidula unifasciata]
MAETVEGEGAEEGERDEGGHALADSSESRQQDVINETSMVFIEDLDHSIQSKSGSSFYASADEATEVVSRFDEIKDEEKDKALELSDVPEDASSTATADTFPSADLDFSLLSDKDKVEDDPAWDGSSSHRSQTEAPVSSGAPLAVPEESPRSSAVETTESVTSRLDILLKSGSDTSQDTPAAEEEQLEASNITEVLTVCQNSPSTVSKENIRILVSLLRKRVPELHSTVLNCVLRVAAFTQNVKPLRDSGCLEVVADQVQEACRTVTGEGGAELLNSLCQVLTNLTLDPKCQADLEETVPALIDLLLSSDSEPIKLSALRPLINFSSQSTFHNRYINAVQSLYDLLDTGSHIARVQSLKILVNLSLNETMMPHLLASKAPRNLLELLDMPTPTDLTLRTLTMLANLEVALNNSSELLASIPEEAKTASAETVYKLLHGADRLSFLRSKVLRLTRHNNEDVAHQASKLLQYIQEKSASVK